MAFEFINVVAKTGAGTTSAVNMAGADFFVVCLSKQTTGETLSDSVNGSTRWVAPPGYVWYNQPGGIWYCWNANSSSSMTFTMADSGGSYQAWTVYGFRGSYKTSNPLFVERHNQYGYSSNTMQVGPLSPPSTGASLFVVTVADTGAASSYTIDSGFTSPMDAIPYQLGVNYGLASSYKIKTDAAAEGPTITSDAELEAGAGMMVFLAADVPPLSVRVGEANRFPASFF